MATKIGPKLNAALNAAVSAAYPRIPAEQRRQMSAALTKLVTGWASYPTVKERKMYVKKMMEKCAGLLPQKSESGLVFRRGFLFEEKLKSIKPEPETLRGGVILPCCHRRIPVIRGSQK